MQFIEQWLGIDFSQPMEFVIAFIAVMVLIALVALVVRSLVFRGGDGFGSRGQRRQRLFVGEWVRVDEKRRLILVRRDDVEHLLLIGGNSDLVVEQDVLSRKPQAAPVAAAPMPQPDVYTPPEEPRLGASDPSYRSPLRTTGATETSGSDIVATDAGSPSDKELAGDDDSKLTGLQAARARIAALRRKSAEMSASSAAATTSAGAAAVAPLVATPDGSDSDAGDAEASNPAADSAVPSVGAIDLDKAIAEAVNPAPEVKVDTGDEGADATAPDVEHDADTDATESAANVTPIVAPAKDTDPDAAAEPREDDLAARLQEALTKPA